VEGGIWPTQNFGMVPPVRTAHLNFSLSENFLLVAKSSCPHSKIYRLILRCYINRY